MGRQAGKVTGKTGTMPVISYFFGIYIRMYHGDHQPPHIHAEYQGHEAFVDIVSGEIIAGGLPTRAARPVRKCCVSGALNTRRNCRKIGRWRNASNRSTPSREPTMIKLTRAEYLGGHRLRLSFSDGNNGVFDATGML
ncbi:MAG: DUF4160 domain-containing protein, partial [Azospira sp.]|nr:DUF4160 domain-containing protein [Azospira sp.]